MPTPVVSDAVTHGIRITAQAVFSPADSDPSAKDHVFRYTITISNDGQAPARLISRHWIIIDGSGNREEVKGPGVIGKTPRLASGASFEYQSFCKLKTSWGTMEGIYLMRRDDGEEFNVSIPRFYLKMT